MYVLTAILFIACLAACQSKPVNENNDSDVTYEELTKLDLLRMIQKNEATVKALTQKLTDLGHSKYSSNSLQWQSLHMSAAAVCRSISPSGGSGGWANAVYPHIYPNTCEQICNSTVHTNCDGEFSIQGKLGQFTAAKSPVGYYYNYGCKSKGYPPYDETKSSNGNIMGSPPYFSYCCCRK